MTWLSENPWPLAGTCAVAAVACLMALRLTQQGKYLIWAGAALGLGLLILGGEWLWVTDRERIERVIYDMADAAEQSDFDRIEAHLAPEFDLPGGLITRAYIRGRLSGVRFEFIRIAQLEIEVARLARRGKADFLAQASWEERQPGGGPDYNATPPPGVGFSVGFLEADPGVWQVTRIDVTRAPAGLSEGSVADYIARGAN